MKKILGFIVCIMLISVSVYSVVGNVNDEKILNRNMNKFGLLVLELVADAGGPYNGVENISINFYGNVSGGTPPYSWYWDFGDGHQDLAITNYWDEDVSILLGIGDGTFDTAVDYEVGDHPTSVTSADFDSDGDKDLAVANRFENNISVLLGNDDGTFGTKINYPTGSDPNSVTSADFNEDGDTDLAAPNFVDDDISVLLGNGDGTFMPALNYDTGNWPIRVCSEDFNGDEHQDLAVTNYHDDNVSVLLGIGDGTFDTAVDYEVGDWPVTVTSADFDSDGDKDLAVANYGDISPPYSDTISVLLGNGDGTFETAMEFSAGYGPISVISADFDNNGDMDLATTNSYDHDISILLGNGDGTFMKLVDYGIGPSPHSLTSADFNGDGNKDLAVTCHQNETVSVVLGNGDGTFGTVVNYGVGAHPTSIISADFNGDGGNSSVQNPSYTYSYPGDFIATLVVTDDNGATAIDTVSVHVVSELEADANGPYTGTICLSVKFKGIATGGFKPYTSWNWDFGDGNTSDEQNPKHKYAETGNYTVTLNVTDNQTYTDEDVTWALVSYNEPEADANGSYNGYIGFVITFSGQATGGCQPYSWYWDFGDGDTSTQQNPNHQYIEAENYTVTLTVTDDLGYSDEDVTWANISNRIPDLDCEGYLEWNNVKPGDTITGDFMIKNIGNPLSTLDWEITGWPEWGTWSFNPQVGEDLTPEDEPVTINVSITAPNEKNSEFDGEVKIINQENPSDYCTIYVSLTTPKNKALNFYMNIIMWLFDRFPNAFPVLRYILGLYSSFFFI